jgi:hypothetical protein
MALLHPGVRELEPSVHRCINTATALAGADGFGTGALGWCGVIADIPAQLAIQLQTIRQMGKVHGFNARIAAEGAYVLRVLGVGMAGSRTRRVPSKRRPGSLGSMAQKRRGRRPWSALVFRPCSRWPKPFARD